MAYEQLRALAATYPHQESAALPELAVKYHRRYELEILELAAIAAEVTADDIINLGLEPEASPQLVETLELLKYSEDLAGTVEKINPENIGGYISRIKGTYFEVLVRDKLNAGESVGDITLLPGQEARLAESLTQAGWDLEIVNEAGERFEQIQLKATESMSYVKSALERYPGIRVITPQELEGRAADMDDVISADIADSALEDTVGGHLDELREDALTDILHQSAEAGFDAIPVMSAVLIGATEAGAVLTGRSTVEESLKRGGARLGKSAVYSTIGAALTATGVGVISVPTVMALRVAEGRVRHRAAMGDHLEEKTQEILHELRASPLVSL